VQILAGVFFEMCTGDADPAGWLLRIVCGDVQPAAAAEWLIVLADLVGLGEDGVVVLFTIPARFVGNAAVQCEGRSHGQLEGVAIHHRQSSRQAEADRTGL
jgi:hypothetical protein